MKNKTFISLLPLTTKRLIIRVISENDIDLLIKLDKQEKTQKYLGGIKNKTKEERKEFVKKKLNKFKEDCLFPLTICLKDRTPIGFLELNIDETNNDAKISYIFDYDYCNHGYCTEACQKLLEIVFDNLKLTKISADTIDKNESSKKVLQKLGFKQIGNHIKTTNKEVLNFLDYHISINDYKLNKNNKD